MKIFRDGIEIELTDGELFEAYKEQLRKNYTDECRYQLEQRGYTDISEDDVDHLVDDYEEHLDYHGAVDAAIVDAWDYILDDDYPYMD